MRREDTTFARFMGKLIGYVIVIGAAVGITALVVRGVAGIIQAVLA